MGHGCRVMTVRGYDASVANNYWSATENSTTNAWNENMSTGAVNNNNKTNNNYVRCVRG